MTTHRRRRYTRRQFLSQAAQAATIAVITPAFVAEAAPAPVEVNWPWSEQADVTYLNFALEFMESTAGQIRARLAELGVQS
jgi:hypothetical protein